jgi:hypothetical protein
MTETDHSAPMTPLQKITLQQVIGTFLYYAQAVDSTMLHALNTLTAAQSDGTQKTTQAMVDLLNYCASNPDAMHRYHASDMVLYTHSNASYLAELKACSQAGGHHYLGNHPPAQTRYTMAQYLIFREYFERSWWHQPLRPKLAPCFNGQEATVLELVHPQPPTPMRNDNTMAYGIINDTVSKNDHVASTCIFTGSKTGPNKKNPYLLGSGPNQLGIQPTIMRK